MQSLTTHEPSDDGEATVRVDTAADDGQHVDPKLFGKFGEHLYMVGMDEAFNAKNAFEAQALHNATFAGWKFQRHGNAVDGGRPAVHDPDVIEERIEGYVDVHDFPEAERLHDAYRDGTALWWFPVGDEDAVRTSPDVGTAGDRAQRLEIDAPAEASGLGQWCYLPLHRTTGFEGTLTARGVDPATLSVALHEVEADGTLGEELAATTIDVGETYETVAFELDLPDDVDDSADALYACSVTAAETAHVVLDRLLLYPDDHVDTADPELVELLRDADLPLMRWPGGNFVSGYDWRDGVGPIEERPTKPNPAWDGVESNLFGTHEFIQFCEAVGCEPMICLNAGSGTAEDAAKWVEYCNGDPDETEMGALRAEHGHPEPYDVTYWEIGNEIYGEWQVSWTTPEGNADRFERFREAMTAVDDSIECLACGNRLTDWNEPLLERVPEQVRWITDHVLIGSGVGPEDDSEELFNAYMALASSVMDEYDELEARMRAAGIDDPKLALTELQFFAFPEEEDVQVPTSASISEALYAATFVHEAIRSEGFVEMITHSGLGNHGGGIQKHKERVWGHPCHYYHGMGSALFDGEALPVSLACPTYDTETAFATDTNRWMGQLDPVDGAPALDPMAVRTADDGDVVVDLIHRDVTAGPIETTIELDGSFEAASATTTVLSGPEMDAENTFENPENVTPTESALAVDDDTATVTVDPLSITRVTFHEA
ncbi:alpha-L-arabinofuranosidase C-terminal domain-containing protein [Halarchaeum sp. P4]|uniref:alpha-L-arabinofuranosidase C-terminal domain-containing protein n=1 Tax=Halarchaeum sp. P4 TaxID=3421639 RepID=UPI003EBDC25D